MMILRNSAALLVWLGLCASGVRAATAENGIRFYVDSHGWHTGVILPVARIPRDLDWPIARDFRGYDFIEVGWGHKAFYMARRFDVGLAFSALFGVSPSVLHVCGVSGSPAEYFVESTVYEVRATPVQFRRLCASIAAATRRDASGGAIYLGRGLYGASRFYDANGRYYFPNTCNYWTAERLRLAGYDVSPLVGLSAGGVAMQVRRLQREQEIRKPARDSAVAASP